MVREQSSASAPASIFKEQTLLTGRGYKLLWRLASGSRCQQWGHPLGKNQVLWRRYNPSWAPIGSKLVLVRTWQKEVNGGQSAQVIAAQWARLHVRRRTCKVVRDLKGLLSKETRIWEDVSREGKQGGGEALCYITHAFPVPKLYDLFFCGTGG